MVPDLFGAAILKMQIVILIIVSFTALLKIKRDFFFIVLLNLYIILYCKCLIQHPVKFTIRKETSILTSMPPVAGIIES